MSYLTPVSLEHIRCIDERNAKESNATAPAMPGGIYGIIDAIKIVSGCTEEEAWEKAKSALIPCDGHTDEQHNELGCGYGKLVEQYPEKIGVLEAIPVLSRFERIKKENGMVLTLIGNHSPTHAVINEISNLSINQKKANDDGYGIFCFDKWAARNYGHRLGYDTNKFADVLESLYKKTVCSLSDISSFTILEQ